VTRARAWTLLILIASVALFALYVWAALSWAYSDGERAGILQKFTRKGWICKTYEGELAMSVIPGVAPTIWFFSVRDERLAPQFNAALGKRVVLHYREHRGLPGTCFGDTSYFVSSVRAQE
jgi:hypothetical protein